MGRRPSVSKFRIKAELGRGGKGSAGQPARPLPDNVDAQMLRQKAEQVRQLARNMTARETAKRLMEFSAMLDARAARIEAYNSGSST